MRLISIKENTNVRNCCDKLFIIIELLIDSDIKSFKFFLYITVSIIVLTIILLELVNSRNAIVLKEYKKYVRDCKNFINYKRKKIYNKNPYIAICISVYNMENYIYQNLLSILNQSFQDFEIIIFNYNSNCNTEAIIKKIQLEDDRIKLISHSTKIEFYDSKYELILNSNGKFILFIEPNNMYLNGNLFQELFEYNQKNNLDIIEFSVYQQISGKNKIYISDDNFETHDHKFRKDIIKQPELSNILYYFPNTIDYTYIICRTLFNKLIRRELLIRAYVYLNKNYYNKYNIINDDTIINVISYQYANNYSNLNIPGYLNIISKGIKLRNNYNHNLKQIKEMNYIYFMTMFYDYIQNFNKDINFLFNEMKHLKHYFLNLKDYNMTKLIKIQVDLIKQILKNKNISNDFNNYLTNLLVYYQF